MAHNYYLELVRMKPINCDGLLIYPVSFGEICDTIGLDNFEKCLMPFLMTKECLEGDAEKLNSLNLFEDVILKDKTLSQYVGIILGLFCKAKDVVKIGSEIHIRFEDRELFIIDKNNFDDICEVIMKINAKSKIEIEKPPKNMSARQRDIWEKLQKGRAKSKSENEVHIYDILNIIEYGGKYHLPIEEIEKWTLWKIMNCYKAIVNVKTYDDSLKICLVSGDGKSISDKNHWHSKLMVRE